MDSEAFSDLIEALFSLEVTFYCPILPKRFQNYPQNAKNEKFRTQIILQSESYWSKNPKKLLEPQPIL